MKWFRLGFTICMFSSVCNASFNETMRFDNMNNKQVYERTTYAHGNSLGFRCDSGRYDKDLFLTFSGKDNIATPNQSVDFRIKIDNGRVYNLKGNMFTSSYKGGAIRNVDKRILYELKQGTTAYVQVHVFGRREMNTSFNLSGSNKAINDVSSRCDIQYQADNYVNINREIKRLQRERDREIHRIDAEYARKIAQLRAQNY
ncbi:hypothetical protein QWY97_18150 [Vibrio cortegadensis]|uniref:hypothetical protein n=1 Tax=Vibrio cortegadensis TaxID=1328770 RepID=UPI0021C2F5FA|nr:hypothetical protein [Vibrio cortegadensis]MDN3699250.1 hypothetical protein [Vibrio cortegadensis]